MARKKKNEQADQEELESADAEQNAVSAPSDGGGDELAADLNESAQPDERSGGGNGHHKKMINHPKFSKFKGER